MQIRSSLIRYIGNCLTAFSRCRGGSGLSVTRDPMPPTCGKCNAKLPDEVPGLATSERTPFPTCNSTARNFAIELKATVGAHAQLSRKARARGEKKPFIEGKSGDDLYRKTGRWSVLDRTLDRRKDQY